VTRLLDGPTIDRVLDVELAIEAMRRCFRQEGEGKAGDYARVDVSHGNGWMRVLPAVMDGMGVYGHKTINLNDQHGVRYLVIVYDLTSGELRGILDGEAITNARTGATAAVAADLLAPEGVTTAAVIGTGWVARAQVPALHAVRPAEEIRVYSRLADNRSAFVEELRDQVDTRLVACERLEDAIEGANLITLATKSSTPVLSADALTPGVHVNSMGSARPVLCELDPAAFNKFDLVACDSVELVFSESGDGIAAVRDHGFDVEGAVDLAHLVTGQVEARTSETQLTLFKSTGTGLQDLALAASLLEIAEAEGVGATFDDLQHLKRFVSADRT